MLLLEHGKPRGPAGSSSPLPVIQGLKNFQSRWTTFHEAVSLYTKAVHRLKVSRVNRLLDEVLSGENQFSRSSDQFERDWPCPMVGPVDHFGAYEAIGLSEVEDEIIELSLVADSAGKGLPKERVLNSWAKHKEGVDVQRLGKVTEKHSVLFRFEDLCFGGSDRG